MRPVRKRLPQRRTADHCGAALAAAPASAEVVAIGQVGAPYGVRGWLHIVSFTAPPSNLLNYQPWQLRLARGADAWDCWRPCALEAVKAHGEAYVASFADIQDRGAAVRLAGAQIGVPASSLPPLQEDEFYWRDLIGLRVLNQNGEDLGVVERLLPAGGHDVMVVRGAAELLIPFVDVYVTDVRLDEGCIRIEWEGMD